jgi:hypothetical protein
MEIGPQARARLPAHVRAAVIKMLALAPGERFGTCAGFVGALRREEAGEEGLTQRHRGTEKKVEVGERVAAATLEARVPSAAAPLDEDALRERAKREARVRLEAEAAAKAELEAERKSRAEEERRTREEAERQAIEAEKERKRKAKQDKIDAQKAAGTYMTKAEKEKAQKTAARRPWA